MRLAGTPSWLHKPRRASLSSFCLYFLFSSLGRIDIIYNSIEGVGTPLEHSLIAPLPLGIAQKTTRECLPVSHVFSPFGPDQNNLLSVGDIAPTAFIPGCVHAGDLQNIILLVIQKWSPSF